jgi:hypothetical protein
MASSIAILMAQLFENIVKKMYFTTILLLLSLDVKAQLNIPKVDTPPVLKDYKNPSNIPSNAGLLIKDFVQSTPGDGNAPSYMTKAFLSYDHDNFYAIFVAHANQQHLIARHSRRENNSGEDFVMLQIDTFKDKQRAFVFYASPLGVQAESNFTEGKEEDFDYDTQWKSEGELTDFGYLVKIAIPFKSLRYANVDRQEWGLSVARYVPEFTEFITWPHISKQKPSVIDQFASVQINDRIPSQRNIQFSPYVFSGKDKFLSTKTKDGKKFAAFVQQHKTQIGLDTKYVWNNSVTIDLTLNPDFSEVESDEPQVLVDKRFETLFPEKRPIFLENAGFFKTPLPLFFSRRIIEPDAGIRITGRQDQFTFGALAMNDASDFNYGKANIGVIRGQGDIGNWGNLGFLFSNRKQNNSSHSVMGADIRVTPFDNWIVTGQVATSQSEAAIKNNDHLAYVEAIYGSRAFTYTGKHTNIGKNFEANLGFIPRIDIKQSEQQAQYTWFADPKDWKLTQAIKATLTHTSNQQNAFQDQKVHLLYTIKAKQANTYTLETNRQSENLADRKIKTTGWLLGWNSRTLPQFNSLIKFGQRQALNYQYVDHQALSGDARNAQVKLKWLIGRHWSLNGSYFWNDLRHSENTIYRDRLARFDVSYQLDNYWGASLTMDYHNRFANQQWSKLKNEKSLNANLQLRYVLSPGSSMYVGYVDRQENLSLYHDDDGLLQSAASRNLDVHIGKRFFIKLSYVFY